MSGAAGRRRFATALLAGALLLAISPTLPGQPGWLMAASMLLCVLAAAVAIEDLARMLIPDGYTAAIALVASSIAYGLGGWTLLGLALFDALVVGGCLLAVTLVYERLRGRSGLGFGDVKLLAASAILLGIWGVGVQVLLACVAGLAFASIRAVRRGRPLRAITRIPFATFLAPAMVLVWAWGY